MATPGPQKVHRYGAEFKLQAVQMSQQSGVRIKDVAATLGIHPFMLSKWRDWDGDFAETFGVTKSDIVDATYTGSKKFVTEV